MCDSVRSAAYLHIKQPILALNCLNYYPLCEKIVIKIQTCAPLILSDFGDIKHFIDTCIDFSDEFELP